MKRIISALLSLALALSLSVCAVAADYEKVTVTSETAKIYISSSTKSDELRTVKEGYSFTPIGETKNYWKIQYKLKGDDTIYVGYMQKSKTDIKSDQASAQSSTSTSSTSQSSISSTQQSKTVYWVRNGEVYHTTENCTTLKRSTNIQSGTKSESGKSRACNVCG